MSEPDDDRRVDMDTVLEFIQADLGDLMDENHKLAKRLRCRADRMFTLAVRAEDMAADYRKIGQLCIDMAYEHALMVSDSIAAEYSVPPEEEDDEDDE